MPEQVNILVESSDDKRMTLAPTSMSLRSKYAYYDEHYSSKDQHNHLGIRTHPKETPFRRRAPRHHVEGPTTNDESYTENYGRSSTSVHNTTNTLNVSTANKLLEHSSKREQESYPSRPRKTRS
jgi:hypothetical protein